MIREKIEAHREKTILTYCITNDNFLKQMHPICKKELFKTPMAREVYTWCAEYFDEFAKAPGTDITDLYLIHKANLDEDATDLIEPFLQNLSDSYTEEPQNLDYIVKQSIEYLRIRSLENLRDELDAAVKLKDYSTGEAAITSFGRVEQNKCDAVNVITDDNAIISAFTDESETLFRLPGAIGELCGDFKRTDFIAFLAFAKLGKSAILWHISQAAMEQGNKVLFITLEMPVNQMMRRIWCSLMGRPKRTKEITIPYFYKDNDSDEQWRIDWLKEEREGFKPELEAIHGWRDVYRKYFRSGDIKLASMPAKSVTVKEVIGYIDNLEYFENWIPDVVVIDYADLIGSRLKGEVRHQLDDIWSNLRRFALERNVCVVTASQSGRASANADATEETIAEDIRKIAHVTKMIAINGSKEERAAGLRRLAMLAERDDSMVFDHVYVTNCLDIGRFALDSRFKKDVYIEKRTRGEGD
jgi:replicative DNA helicase